MNINRNTTSTNLSKSLEPLAIIGIGCRFPANVKTPDEFWTLLKNGQNAVIPFPLDRKKLMPDASILHEGGFLEDVDKFDASFFQISPREAMLFDPQQRLLLEVTWEAIENSGIDPYSLAGSETGFFVGIYSSDYLFLQVKQHKYDSLYNMTGNSHASASGRVPYFLDLKGPAVAVDTASSASMSAFHIGCQNLWSGDCNLALVAGVNLILSFETSLAFSNSRMLSLESRCKAFDASADGYARGEGCGVVVIKRLSDALADNDNILAIVRSSAMNQDGASIGLTVPNQAAQEAVIKKALKKAGLTPDTISYIEAHGSGTPVGDPIEGRGIWNTYCSKEQTKRRNPLYVGSVKSNIGHLEAAAGIAGIIKTVLSLQHKYIPPHLHFKELNPKLKEWQEQIKIPVKGIEWDWSNSDIPRRAGVSGFGFSGTNVHVILEQAPVSPTPRPLPYGEGDNYSLHSLGRAGEGQYSLEVNSYDFASSCELITLSAKNENALYEMAQRYVDFCKKSHELPLKDSSELSLSSKAPSTLSLSELSFTTHLGRSHFDHRLAVVVESIEQLSDELTAFINQEQSLVKRSPFICPTPLSPPTHIEMGNNITPSPAGRAGEGLCFINKIAFLFTGQGSQYVDMGKELYITEPVFRDTINRAESSASQLLGRSLIELIYPSKEPQDNDIMESPVCVQVVNFVVECAIADLWRSWGITPDAVLGHSLGEFAAAYIAGVMSLEDGIRIVTKRGHLMEQGKGLMFAVSASESEVLPFLDSSKNVVIGVVNGPQNVVISGDYNDVNEAVIRLNEAGCKTRKLTIPIAAHSPMLDCVLDQFEDEVKKLSLSEPKMLFISSMTGKAVSSELTQPQYWRKHLRNQVRFGDGLNSLKQEGFEIFIEIGPKPILLGILKQNLPDYGLSLPSLQPPFSDKQTLLQSMAELYVRGVPLDWSKIEGFRKSKLRRITLPNYPFQRESYWLSDNIEEKYEISSQPFKQILPKTSDEQFLLKKSEKYSILKALEQSSVAGQKEILIKFLQDKVRNILHVGSKYNLSLQNSLKNLGFDSLMMTELANFVNSELKVKIPLNKMFQLGNIQNITDWLLPKISLSNAEIETSQTDFTKPALAKSAFIQSDLENSSFKTDETISAQRAIIEEIEEEIIDFHKASYDIPQIHAVVTEQQRRKLKIGDNWVYDFASCNYLGLDLHPEVMKSIPPALQKWGVHPSWTRAVASPAIYEELEDALADFLKAPSVLVFPAITLLHAGVLPILAGEDGVILKDIFAHTSIHEGTLQAQAVGAEVIEFRHNDVEDLEEKLKRYPLERTKIIAVDGVYSMSGAYAKLSEFSKLARTYNAYIYLDDAHGIGIIGEYPTPEMPYGKHGNGLVRHFGLDYKKDRMIYVAGLSKSFSSFGAFITCIDEDMRNKFRSASTFIFSGPSPVASLASAIEGIRLNALEGEEWRKQVYKLTYKLVSEAKNMGFEVVNDNYFPIVGVVIGRTKDVIEACKILWEFGILITPAIFPIVPIDRGLLRFSITAANTEAEIDRSLEALYHVKNKSKQ
ncbi:MAG: aminotransferase class I/II-fold pyridoxal phosphate-dependent enzyme [Desulfamplus sp.]|nr:aminotransferase class I/II-fold pyridoxal phosphate-dependent enzyme [Desulfamplus sp.]